MNIDKALLSVSMKSVVIFHVDGHVTLINNLIILPLKPILDKFCVLTFLFFLAELVILFDFIDSLQFFISNGSKPFWFFRIAIAKCLLSDSVWFKWVEIPWLIAGRLCELCLFFPLQFLVAKGRTVSWILQQCLKKKQISCFLYWIAHSQNEPLPLQAFLCSFSVGFVQQCGRRNIKCFGLAGIFKGSSGSLPEAGTPSARPQLKALSSLTFKASRDEASPASLGSLFQCLIALTVENSFHMFLPYSFPSKPTLFEFKTIPSSHYRLW